MILTAAIDAEFLLEAGLPTGHFLRVLVIAVNFVLPAHGAFWRSDFRSFVFVVGLRFVVHGVEAFWADDSSKIAPPTSFHYTA